MSILPTDEWPPKQYRKALNQIRLDDQTLRGTPTRRTKKPQPYRSRAQFNGGLVGAASRAMLGKPHMPEEGAAALPQHDTLPFDLTVLSADVLVGEPPAFTLHGDDEANEQAVEALTDFTGTDRFAADLHQAFRNAAGLGWVYGLIRWDTAVSPHPWVEWKHPDEGMPIFEFGKLTGLIFWDTYQRDKTIYRLLQRHTPGRVEYELHAGTEQELGMVVPLTDLPETAYLANIVDQNSGFNTGTQRLTAVMLLNLDGAQEWRTDPYLRYLGMSDVRKGGDVWAALDQEWTDLLHEVESARARLLIPEHYLKSLGPGNGNVFEWFRDVYTKPRSGDPDAGETIERIQFEMRVAEYLQVIESLQAKALSSVGWSAITFGSDAQATGDMTATEIRARSTRTLHTHKTKSRFARAALGELATAWLAIDADLNGYQPPTMPVQVSMREPVEATEDDEARTLSTLRAAGIASLRYAVRRLHPEWTVEEVDAEIRELQAELTGVTPPDPLEELTNGGA